MKKPFLSFFGVESFVWVAIILFLREGEERRVLRISMGMLNISGPSWRNWLARSTVKQLAIERLVVRAHPREIFLSPLDFNIPLFFFSSGCHIFC
jgi:hypothetical protein